MLFRGVGKKGEEGRTFTVEEEDDVLAEGFVEVAVRGEGFDDFVREGGGGGLGWRRVVRGDHVLFVEDELDKTVRQGTVFLGKGEIGF